MKDKLGNDIVEGSIVVCPRGPRELAICRVKKINPKTITLVRLDQKSDEFLAWGEHTLLVESIDANAYILRYGR